ncbi:hypothetical protein V6Z12_A11G183500 [Gossypium hirsutum]
MSSHSLPISSLLALFFLFVLTRVPTILSVDDPRYSTCRETLTCGSVSNISYPFWGLNRLSYCGQPGFELRCENDVAEIMMNENTLRVLDIDPERQILKVAREDYWNGYCPTKFINTSINYDHFNYGSNLRNLTLFYGCNLPTTPTFTVFTNCSINNTLTDMSYATRNMLVDTRYSTCRGIVVVPVYEAAAKDLEVNPMTIQAALRGGFELQWKADNDECRRCRDSDGVCGYNQISNSFTCFCSDKPSETTCLPPTEVFSNNYLSCSVRSSCGNISDIGYPFWGLNRPESCGYPGFKLSCSESELEITINSATYRVLAINKASQTLHVSRTDYSENLCPTHLINSTFESETSPFRQNGDSQDIRLYYGCQPLTAPQNLTSIPGISNRFECTINNTNIVGYYVTREFAGTVIGNFLRSCSNSVIIPVPNSQVPSLEEGRDADDLEEAAKIGFQLWWSADDALCNSCVNKGGQKNECQLIEKQKGEEAQFGGKGERLKIRETKREEAQSMGIRKGAARGRQSLPLPPALGAAGVIILIGIGTLCVRQHRRKKIVAQLISRDLPTSPSSKGPTTSTTNYSQSNSSYSTSKYDIERGSTYFGAHVFNYEELEEATDNFNPSKQLGEGGFGTVYYGVLRDGRVVAVKRLYENNFKRVDQYMNEIEILTPILHPNLVKLYGCTSRRSRELLLVYEYIPNGTVADHLHGKRSNSGLLTWHVRLRIAFETATALAFLHGKEVIHRDVKSNNILLDKNFHVKVADFGLSRLFPNDVTHVSTAPQGTPGYVDPEYHQCYHLTEKSDVYSFGVVLVELISAKKAVDISRHRHDINLANMAISRIQNQALHELVDPSLGFENDCVVKNTVTAVAGLAFRCLQQERDMRPSMEEVLEALKEIKDVRSGSDVVDIRPGTEVVDIKSEDVGLLKSIPPPFSPDYATDKWVSFSTITTA